MAPDLNSVPPSPKPAFQTVPRTPSLPLHNVSNSSHASPRASMDAMEDNAGVGIGPGPLRHPRPLTAGELLFQVEKEQEAVVNRLSRELSLLRQQTASVASTASSTSTSHHESDHSLSIPTVGSTHPTPDRRHRSSSTLSTRSAAAIAAGMSSTGIAPPRDAAAAHFQGRPVRPPLSTDNSASHLRRSEAPSPSSASFPHHEHTGQDHPRSPVGVRRVSMSSARSTSRARGISGPRYEDVVYHHAELEAAKRENEALRKQVQELERRLSECRRASAQSVSSSMPAPA